MCVSSVELNLIEALPPTNKVPLTAALPSAAAKTGYESTAIVKFDPDLATATVWKALLQMKYDILAPLLKAILGSTHAIRRVPTFV